MNLLANPFEYRAFQNGKPRLSISANHQRQNPFTYFSKLREISKTFVKATKTRKFRKPTPRYSHTTKELKARPIKFDTSCLFNYPAGTKNDSLSNSTIIPVVPANPLAATVVVVFTSPPDSLEMKSKVAKTSRGGSNQSTSQSFIDAYLARRKREEINKLMEMLEGCLDSLDNTAHAHSAGNSSQRCNSSHSSSSTGSNTSTPQKPTRQKRTLDRDSFDEFDPGRDGNDQDKRGGKRTRIASSPTLKLACPFFKRDPAKYKDRQACTGPGYTSISRLKEHIYRAHRQPDNKCNRCCAIFSGSDLLEEHQRLEIPCKVSQDKSTDGITEVQYFKLRKKPVGRASDAERWKEVYLTIFPKASVVPSPYYDYEDSNRVPSYSQDGMKILEEELLAGVRNDLEDRFEQFADETRESFVEIVKGRFKQITEQWSDKQEKPEASPALVDVRQEPLQFDIPAFEDFDFNFDSFLCGSDMNYNNGNIFGEGSTGGFLYASDVSDSAYGSMDSPKSPRKVGI